MKNLKTFSSFQALLEATKHDDVVTELISQVQIQLVDPQKDCEDGVSFEAVSKIVNDYLEDRHDITTLERADIVDLVMDHFKLVGCEVVENVLSKPDELKAINDHIQETYPDLEIAYDEDDKHAYWYSENNEKLKNYLAGLPETTVAQENKSLDEWLKAADEIMKDSKHIVPFIIHAKSSK